MKHSILLSAVLSIFMLAATNAHAAEKNNRHQDNARLIIKHSTSKKQAVNRRNDQFRKGHRNTKKHIGKNRRYQNNRNAEYFIGGLLLGSLAQASHHDYKKHHGNNGHRISYWRNNHGECFRVEHRKHRKVYVGVPRNKCY